MPEVGLRFALACGYSMLAFKLRRLSDYSTFAPDTTGVSAVHANCNHPRL